MISFLDLTKYFSIMINIYLFQLRQKDFKPVTLLKMPVQKRLEKCTKRVIINPNKVSKCTKNNPHYVM